MIVTTELNMDFALRGMTPTIHAVQDDKYSRKLKIALFNNGASWAPPAGTTGTVSYSKPDGTGGSYDTLPDGSAAVELGANSIFMTVKLAPQVLTCAGTVNLAVSLQKGQVQLSTFRVKICVEARPGAAAASEDYYNVQSFVAASGWEPGMYLGTDENGKVVAMEAPTAVEVAVEDVLDAMPVVSEMDLTNFPASGFTEIVDGETVEHTSSYDESTGILMIDDVTIKLPIGEAT